MKQLFFVTVLLTATGLVAQIPLHTPLIDQKKEIRTLKRPGTSSRKIPAYAPDFNDTSDASLVGIFGPPTGHGEVTAMVKVGHLLYVAVQKGLHVADVSDPRKPKNIYFTNINWARNIQGLKRLDARKLLAWRKLGKRKIRYKSMEYEPFAESLGVLSLADPKRPGMVMQKIFYLLDVDQTCRKVGRLKGICPMELGRKIGQTVLNDAYFGYARTLEVRGEDIYLAGTFGIARFEHGIENVSFEGGSTTTDSVRFRGFFDPVKEIDGSCSEKKCKKSGCTDNFHYAGRYLTVTFRDVVTPFVVLDRDLKKKTHWLRSKKGRGLAAAAMESGDFSYLFELNPKNGGRLAIDTLRIRRDGGTVQVKSYTPKLFEKAEGYDSYDDKLKLKRFGDKLMLFGTYKNQNLVEIMSIADDFSLSTKTLLKTGKYPAVDLLLEPPYLYLLSNDAVRIYRLEEL